MGQINFCNSKQILNTSSSWLTLLQNTLSNSRPTSTTQNGSTDINLCSTFWTLMATEKSPWMKSSPKLRMTFAPNLEQHQLKPSAIKMLLKLFSRKSVWIMAKKLNSQNSLKDGETWQNTT